MVPGHHFDETNLPSQYLPIVGGRLGQFAKEWEKLTDDSLVLSITRKGYMIELLSKPPLSNFPIPMELPRTIQKRELLLEEILSLVKKGAVEEVLNSGSTPGFYSPIFLVNKKEGSKRPVFNLKPLNPYVEKQKFKMTTPADITKILHTGDWAITMDLKDAYFHVPIHRKSRHMLMFAVLMEGKLRVFQFTSLPFGLTSAPRIFTKMTTPLANCAHAHALILLLYLDDWLLKHPDRLDLIKQRDWLLELIQRLGFILNLNKSNLEPTHHLDTGWIYPPLERVEKIEHKVQKLLPLRVTTAYYFLSMLGVMNSAADAIPLGRLHLRPLQMYLTTHWTMKVQPLSTLIPLYHDQIGHPLQWWLNREYTRSGVKLDTPEPQCLLYSDASKSGWGAHVDDLQAKGTWNHKQSNFHINRLELLAVKYALEEFKHYLRGKSIMIMTDNTSVVYYIKKQGGTKSIPLFLVAREILTFAQTEQMVLRVKHVPGKKNVIADLLSRQDKIVHTEWTLIQSVVDTLFLKWDKPMIDLFATRLNHRLPTFVSPMEDNTAFAVDAMAVSWKGMYAYAFPPYILILQILEKIIRDHPCEVILVAPKWPRQPWYARLLDLLVDYPLVLPPRGDLLFQPHNRFLHKTVTNLGLHAWRLSSNLLKREAFQSQLPGISPQHRENPLEQSMIVSGKSTVIGVINAKLIHSKSLYPN